MEKILNGLKSQLRIRKQYIQIDDINKTNFLSVSCLQLILICPFLTATFQYCLLL